MNLYDTLVNFVSRLGTSTDKNTYNRYGMTVLTAEQLETAYRGDWVARKCVDIPAKDATRAWRSWQAKDDQIERIEAEEKRLALQRKTRVALQKARLYGGAGMVLGMRDRTPERPLDVEAVREGDLLYVHVLSRLELKAGDLNRDLASPLFGEPAHYEVSSEKGVVRIHPSRVVRFLGKELPDQRLYSDGWPADSVLQSVDDAVKNVGLTSSGVAALVNEAKMDVLKIPNFMQNIGTTEYKNRMLDRLSLVNTSKSLMSTILTDKEEEWQRITTSFSSLPDILKIYLLVACGAVDIPATRFVGQSASGLNATGEGDLRNYYDSVRSEQETETSPALERLDETLVRSTLGSRPPEIHYEWRSLWQMDDVQRASVSLSKAQAYKIDVDAGGINPEVLAKARLNQLVEDGTYPGLEDAMAEAEDDGVLEYDPEAQAQFAAAAAASGKRDGDKDGIYNESADAEPRTLYVRRDVVNREEILAWARKWFDDPLVDDLHVTVVYSRNKLDWAKIREDSGLSYGPAAPEGVEVPEGGMYVPPGGMRMVERLGRGGEAVVLMFTSSALCWRHESIEAGGASHDWPDYQPHVTIKVGGVSREEDLTKIEPYRGRIVLGPEIFEEVRQ